MPTTEKYICEACDIETREVKKYRFFMYSERFPLYMFAVGGFSVVFGVSCVYMKAK
jgi:hypothetical protein